MTSYISDYAGLFTGQKNSYVVHIPPFSVKKNKEGVEKVTASKVYYRKVVGTEEFIPLDISDYEKHLEGSIGLAVSPLMGNNDGLRDSCYFACIDIDVYNSDITLEEIENLFSDYPCIVKHSKSKGFHIFFSLKRYLLQRK